MVSKAPENLKARLKESYDAIAPAYNEWTAQHSELRLLYLDKLIQLLDPPTAEAPGDSDTPNQGPQLNVVELGCGAGIPVTEKLVADPRRRFHVTANDISTAQLDLAKSRFDPKGEAPVVWVQGDMLDLRFPEASVDAVIAMYSIIHLPRDEQDKMLVHIRSWLRSGGYALINFSAEEMEGLVMEKWLDERGWMYWSGWGAEGALAKVREAGLEVVSAEVVDDVTDASFLWVIARKPLAVAG
ncbi:hypothetical protein VTK73DRAFT_3973 [Phialemonium thermophilum]|uniref:Methyltransferase domain-containing protein n=1 Tax=Phialemonium thermophilum TaxID=223376 RepID=A0ABR3WVX4_9PEZI